MWGLENPHLQGWGWVREWGKGRQRVALPGRWNLADLLRRGRQGLLGRTRSKGSFGLNKMKGKDNPSPWGSSLKPPSCGDERTNVGKVLLTIVIFAVCWGGGGSVAGLEFVHFVPIRCARHLAEPRLSKGSGGTQGTTRPSGAWRSGVCWSLVCRDVRFPLGSHSTGLEWDCWTHPEQWGDRGVMGRTGVPVRSRLGGQGRVWLSRTRAGLQGQVGGISGCFESGCGDRGRLLPSVPSGIKDSGECVHGLATSQWDKRQVPRGCGERSRGGQRGAGGAALG